MKTETVLFEPVTPYFAPVSLADLLTEIEAVIKKHVILSDHAAAALAVWVLHTYTFELRDTVAYVAIESPEKRCGKTTLLSVLAAMAHKPLIASNITVGALFRAIHNCSPTLFIDEADTFLAGNSIMRGIINSGNTRRTAYVLRLSAAKKIPEPTASSPAPESIQTGIKKFSCWCPKVIAMIGEAPDTIADRSIVVKMSRKLTTETCAPLSDLEPLNRSSRSHLKPSDDDSPSPGGEGRDEGGLTSAEERGSNILPAHGKGARHGTTTISEIRSKCARFALDAQESIRQHPKIAGQGLNDRAADTFDPLYVIARHAGPDWEKKLHTAALSLNSIDSDNSGTALLLEIFDVFLECADEKIFTRDLIAGLREGPTASQTLRHSAINEYQISKILRPYGVRPRTMRIGKEVSTGYLATDFRDALKRYVTLDEARARMDGAMRRCKLKEEARAEAQKQLDLMNQVLASAPRDRVMTIPEAMAKIRELQKAAQTNGQKTQAC